MRKIILLVFFFLYFLIFSTSKSSAEIFFSDDFNDGSADGWNVEYFTPSNPSHPYWEESQWSIDLDNRYGIRLTHGNMRTFSANGDVNWTNYIYSLDLIGKEGVDKNIIFRYQDLNNWYGFHLVPDGIHFGMMINGSYTYDVKLSNFGFSNDTVYNLKTKINGNLISLTVNGVQLVNNFQPATNPLNNGKIGLYASTGEIFPTSVWFDNVIVCSLDDLCEFPSTVTPTPTPTPTSTPTPTPTATPTPPTPVVFIPGLGGSTNFKEMFLGIPDADGWRMTPGVNVYKNLQKAFEGNNNFYVFYYDWRKSATESAQKLNEFIQNTVQPWNNKVNLVGHSLGGLVGRTCVQITADGCFAENLITVGSPNLGVVDAYPLVEAGEVWRKGFTKLAFELLIHYYQLPGETRRQTLERVAPVLKELLPNFDYLYKNGSIISYTSLSEQNPLLPQLSSLIPLENITKTITGSSYNTLRWITLTEPGWLDRLLGNWPDGKPIDKTYTPEGDKTVLLFSSSFINPLIENTTFNLDHGGIISEHAPLTKIFKLISYNLPSGTYPSLSETENYLVFFVHSPVKLSLLNAPENAYLSDELIIVPEPENKIYTLDLLGTENSFYQLSAGRIFGDSVYWNDYSGMAKSGEGQTFEFRINPEKPEENPLVDSWGTKTKEMVQIRIEEFKKEVLDLHLKKASEQMLTERLNKIKSNINNPEKALNHLGTLRKTIAIFENNKILDSQTASIFRKKSAEIAEYLEFLAFLKPRKTSQNQAKSTLKSAETLKNHVIVRQLTVSGAFVYLEADDKLQKAKLSYENKNYYQSFIFSQEARDLFLEAGMIR